MKKAFLNLLATAFLSMGAVVILYFLQEKPLKNGFNRGRMLRLEKLNVIDLKHNSFYIAGLSFSRIYLGSISAPMLLFSCNYELKDTSRRRLPFRYNSAIDWRLVRTRVDSPGLYMSTYSTPCIVASNLSGTGEKYHALQGLSFDQIVVLSGTAAVINGYHPVSGLRALQRINVGNVWQRAGTFVHPQQQANFSADGFLSYNKEQDRLVFTSYYRNSFVCLDTNLQVLYQARTIDTNAVAKIRSGNYRQGDKMVRTMASPPPVVNKKGYSHGDWMYVESALASDQENLADFEKQVVIDVYHIASGKYSHSIYLPRQEGKKLSDFAVWGDFLVALYGRYLITYNMKA